MEKMETLLSAQDVKKLLNVALATVYKMPGAVKTVEEVGAAIGYSKSRQTGKTGKKK